jgi:hypothetical protein
LPKHVNLTRTSVFLAKSFEPSSTAGIWLDEHVSSERICNLKRYARAAINILDQLYVWFILQQRRSLARRSTQCRSSAAGISINIDGAPALVL